MTSRMGSIWRTLSGATKSEITHSHPLRPTASLDYDRPEREDSLARSYSSLESTGSLAESVTSGSPNTAAGYLESPKAAAAHQQHQHQREQQQQDGKRKPYKVHGMDPYDYWSLIKSL